MKWFWLILQILLSVLLVCAGLIYYANYEVYTLTKDKAQNSITEIKIEDPPRIAIVFGAGVWANGEPSPTLQDRIYTAVELYRAGRVRKLLMSGDNRTENYNEPKAMKEAAVKLGVPEENIIQDFAGRRTYDTCYRAKEIFEVTRAIVITQEFHLNRAIYLCEAVGIDSYGINADRRQYPAGTRRWWALRESVAITAAWINVNLFAPTPILGKKEPIEP
jgi:SanA protein